MLFSCLKMLVKIIIYHTRAFSYLWQPTCMKENARIEKTASFIAQHGIQMEIMLKTKQAGNPQFDFLHFDDKLNPYYKHVVSMIKSGKYKPLQEEEEDHTKKGQLSWNGHICRL